MEKKLSITAENDGQEIVIREGEALKLRYSLNLNIRGRIDTVSRFLCKRLDTLEQENCNITVSRSEMEIFLAINETDPDKIGVVTGKLMFDEDFEAFGINTGKKYPLFGLADFLKMHRYCFDAPSVAMKIVNELKNFKAKVNKEIEKASDNRGNNKILLEQTVNSNIPESFTLKMPIFKGEDPRSFQVEINIIVRDAEMECYLESIEANDLIKQLSGKIIDNELLIIAKLASDIVQIEV